MSNSNEEYYKISGATLTGIANSIRAKNGSSDTYHPSEMEQAIQDIPKTIEVKDANFFDYDGELLYTYTKAEALALTELPPLPTGRQYLTAIGWGRTLASIKTHLQEGQIVDTGVIYSVTDNKTKLLVNIQPIINDDSIDFTFRIKNGTVVIYVDGNVFSTEIESSNSYVGHTVTFNSSTLNNYYGEHLIELEYSGNYDYIFKSCFSDKLILTEAFLDDKCVLDYEAFKDFRSLKSITLTENSLGQSGYAAFYNCCSLKSLTVPLAKRIDEMLKKCFSLKFFNIAFDRVLSSNSNGCISSCISLNSVIAPLDESSNKYSGIGIYENASISKMIIPKNSMYMNATYFGDRCYNLKYACIVDPATYSYRECYQLTKIKIYDTVTVIGNNGDYGRYAIEIDMTDYTDPTNLPTLTRSDFFLVVEVLYFSSQEMIDALSIETNWSIHADKFKLGEVIPP